MRFRGKVAVNPKLWECERIALNSILRFCRSGIAVMGGKSSLRSFQYPLHRKSIVFRIKYMSNHHDLLIINRLSEASHGNSNEVCLDTTK